MFVRGSVGVPRCKRLVFLCGVNRRVVYVLGLTAIVEVFVFARLSRVTFDLSSTQSSTLKAFLDQRPGDYRIFYQRIPNIAMGLAGKMFGDMRRSS